MSKFINGTVRTEFGVVAHRARGVGGPSTAELYDLHTHRSIYLL